jgi:uncharacterized protein
MDPDAVEIRVLGCLIEKQRTTPDAYPLSLNALRLACNQSTNRDPVVDYDEATIRQALGRLSHRRWVRLTSYHGSRASKYRQLLDEALQLADDELAILGVLMLRGPQTPGELKQRTERLRRFPDLAAILQTLDRLIERELVERLDRRPGQKEERYAQRLGGEEDPLAAYSATGGASAEVDAAARVDAVPAAPGAPVTSPAAEPRISAGAEPRSGVAGTESVARGAAPNGDVAPEETARPGTTPTELSELRDEVAALRAELSELRAEVTRLRDALGG